MEKHPDDQAEKNVENVEAAMLTGAAEGVTGLGGTFPGGINASGISNAAALGSLAMTGGIEGKPKEENPEEED